MSYRRRIDLNPLNSITSLIFLVLFFVALYYIARSIFWLLSLAAPVLLIAALVINHKVVLGYGKWLLNLIKKNPVLGIGASILSIIAYPVTCGFLFAKAMVYRKVDQIQEEVVRRREGEYVEYEEVDSEPTLIELPPIKKKEPEVRSDYEQLFDED